MDGGSVSGRLWQALVDGVGLTRQLPHRSGALRGEAAGDERQGVDVRQVAWELELDRAELSRIPRRLVGLSQATSGAGSSRAA